MIYDVEFTSYPPLSIKPVKVHKHAWNIEEFCFSFDYDLVWRRRLRSSLWNGYYGSLVYDHMVFIWCFVKFSGYCNTWVCCSQFRLCLISICRMCLCDIKIIFLKPIAKRIKRLYTWDKIIFLNLLTITNQVIFCVIQRAEYLYFSCIENLPLQSFPCRSYASQLKWWWILDSNFPCLFRVRV